MHAWCWRCLAYTASCEDVQIPLLPPAADSYGESPFVPICRRCMDEAKFRELGSLALCVAELEALRVPDCFTKYSEASLLERFVAVTWICSEVEVPNGASGLTETKAICATLFREPVGLIVALDAPAAQRFVLPPGIGGLSIARLTMDNFKHKRVFCDRDHLCKILNYFREENWELREGPETLRGIWESPSELLPKHIDHMFPGLWSNKSGTVEG